MNGERRYEPSDCGWTSIKAFIIWRGKTAAPKWAKEKKTKRKQQQMRERIEWI